MPEMLVAKASHSMSNSAEIVDDRVSANAQTLLDESRPDHPGIVGQLEKVTVDGPSQGNGKFSGQVGTRAPAEFLPGELEARMLRRLERDRRAERGDAPAVDFGKRKAGVSAADIGDCDPFQ